MPFGPTPAGGPTIYRAIATVAWLLIVAGWTQRRRRSVHVPLVLAGIAVDFCIVLVLELQRGVVQDAVTTNWSILQATHIGASSLAVLLYFPTLYYGFRLKRGTAAPVERGRHRKVAIAALVMRTLGFACMWSV